MECSITGGGAVLLGGAALAGAPIAWPALAITGTIALAVDLFEKGSGTIDSGNSFEQSSQSFYDNLASGNPANQNLDQQEATQKSALNATLTSSEDLALTVPGTTFTGPAENVVPDIHIKTPSDAEISDAARDYVKDLGRDEVRDLITKEDEDKNKKNKSACGE